MSAGRKGGARGRKRWGEPMRTPNSYKSTPLEDLGGMWCEWSSEYLLGSKETAIIPRVAFTFYSCKRQLFALFHKLK